METRKYIVLTITLLISILCHSQIRVQSRDVKRIGEKAYLMSNGSQYEIRENVLLANLKEGKKKVRDGIKVIKSHSFGLLEIAVPDSVLIEKYIETLEKTGDFECVEFDTEIRPCTTPNDYYYYYFQWAPQHIHANAAWEITTGSPSVKVAILDEDGFELNHPDINYGNDNYSNISVSEGVDYVNDTDHTPTGHHGTMVAGIIAAKTNNSIGIAGIAGGNHSAGVKIIPYRVGGSLNAISAIYDAIPKGVKVINISFDTSSSKNFNQAIAYAYNCGVTIVCATGNGYSSQLYYPASHENTIAVGSINIYDYRDSASNYGNGLDLVAPGEDIISTSIESENYYYQRSGNSLSAPQVSGVAALMLSVDSTLTPSAIRSILNYTATKINPSTYTYNSFGWNEEVGYGLLNACAAVMYVKNYQISGPQFICSSSTGTYTINNLPSSFTVNWYFTDGFGPAAPTLQTSSNTCTINNNLSSSYMGILHADIYYQGNLMKSLQQQVVVYAGFYATYSINHGVSQQLTTSNSVIWVNYGDLVEIKSPNLVAKNVSYSIVTPYLWHYYTFSGDLDVGFPSSAGHLPVVISVQNNTNYSNCDTSHQILLMPTSVLPQPQLNATGGKGTINVELITERNEEALKMLQDLPVSIQIDDTPTWTLEVIDAKKGDKILTKEITGTSTSVALPGKSTGIFLVRATIGEKTLSEKVIVK